MTASPFLARLFKTVLICVLVFVPLSAGAGPEVGVTGSTLSPLLPPLGVQRDGGTWKDDLPDPNSREWTGHLRISHGTGSHEPRSSGTSTGEIRINTDRGSHQVGNIYPHTSSRLGVLIVGMDPGIDHQRALQVLDAAQAVGAHWIRIGFNWSLANPRRDTFNFDEFDWIIGRATAHGLHILPVVMFTPNWASSHPQASTPYLYPPTLHAVGDFASPLGTRGTGYDYLYRFAHTIAARYSDSIDHWELWNEPDMASSLKDGDEDGTSADEYARMLTYFAQGIRDGSPTAKVVLGGLADQPQEPDCDPDYLTRILTDAEYPALDNFDIHNIHTNFRSPDEIQAQIRHNREILNKAGGTDKRIWITETSYSPVPEFQILPGYQDGETGFNRYIQDALALQLNSEADLVFWAALHDYGPDTPESDPYKYSGLYTYDLRMKEGGHIFRRIAQGDNPRTRNFLPIIVNNGYDD